MAIFVHKNEFWSTGFPKTWSAEWKQKDSRYDAKGSLTMLDLLGANSIVYDNDLSKIISELREIIMNSPI